MRVTRKTAATATSSFGVGRRESHDSRDFYSRFTAPTVSAADAINSVPPPSLDVIHRRDARDMGDDVPDDSVALVVTSPPYFAGKEYEQALGRGHIPATYLEYLRLLEDVFAECKRKLEPGGRLAVNVANLGRKPYRSLTADVTTILQDRLGLLLRGEIVWIKGKSAGNSCAWGSFQSAANPVLRDLTERIIVAGKGRFDRALSRARREERKLPSEVSISKDEFLESTTDTWYMLPESAQRVGHPAPFPVELPERLIHLYTYRGDVVLDPFMGSGTSAVAAVRSARHFVGYETDPNYVEIAERRIAVERDRVATGRVAIPASGSQAGEDGLPAAIRRGDQAKAIARRLLHESGFGEIVAGARIAGVTEVSFAARDRAGRRWLFEVCGTFTSTRMGLRRAETLWQAIAKAAIVHAAGGGAHLILLTTGLPDPGSSGEAALTALKGHMIHAVVDMLSEDARKPLEEAAAG